MTIQLLTLAYPWRIAAPLLIATLTIGAWVWWMMQPGPKHALNTAGKTTGVFLPVAWCIGALMTRGYYSNALLALAAIGLGFYVWSVWPKPVRIDDL